MRRTLQLDIDPETPGDRPRHVTVLAIAAAFGHTVEKGLVKPVDAATAPRYMRYVPFWA